MRVSRNTVLTAFSALSVVFSIVALPVVAQDGYYSGQVSSTHHPHHPYHKGYMAQHPKVRAATKGAAIGAAAGAVTGLVTHRGIVRGAAIGAGTGAGVGLIRSSETMKRHPIVKDLATGVAVGGGLGWATGRHGHGIAKDAAVGGALGLGIGALKHL